MKLTITDACIFIELDQLRLTSVFFKLDMEIHTSVDVFNELFPQQQELLKAYQAGHKLFLHSLDSAQRIEMNAIKYPAGLSQNDRTVLFLAEMLDAMVLSTDRLVRREAKQKAIECHGMLWIFDQVVGAGLLSKSDAVKRLQQMMASNIIYQNNTSLLKELSTRFANWSK